MDVCEALQAVLAEAGFDASLKRLDSFTGKEGTIIRRTIPQVAGQYMDTRRTVNFVAFIAVRRRSEREAMEVCDAIADYLIDRPIPSLDGSYTWTATRIYTEPQELALDEDDFYTWVTRVEVEVQK